MDDDEDVHFFTMAGWWHRHETFIMTGWQRYEKSNMKDLKKTKIYQMRQNIWFKMVI